MAFVLNDETLGSGVETRDCKRRSCETKLTAQTGVFSIVTAAEIKIREPLTILHLEIAGCGANVAVGAWLLLI